MPKTKIRFEDLEQGLTAPIAITSNSVNAVSIDGNTFSVDALNNRVGIGTTNPGANLHVQSATNAILNVYGDPASQNFINLGSAGNDRWIMIHQPDNSFSIESAHTADGLPGITPFHILATNGNVGIGTTTPTSKLQVVGLPSYADNAAALSGGLTVGAFYHTAGVLKVVI